MNIKYKYDINKIENNFLEVSFFNENNVEHIDSIKISRDSNGYIDQIQLEQQVNELFQRVVDKKDFLFL